MIDKFLSNDKEQKRKSKKEFKKLKKEKRYMFTKRARGLVRYRVRMSIHTYIDRGIPGNTLNTIKLRNLKLKVEVAAWH